MWAMNHTAWPTRLQKDIEVRYYFDISEVLEHNLTAEDIKVEGKSQQYGAGEQGYATVSGPYQYDGNIYYASIKFEDGRAICPTGQSEHRDEVQFRVSVPDAIYGVSTKGAWDPTNDPSYKGVGSTDSIKSAKALNENFCMYVNGAFVWGIEPDGTKGYSGADRGEVNQPDPPTSQTTEPKTETTTTTSTTTETTTTSETVVSEDSFLYGDTNCDKVVDVSDAVLLCRFLAEDTSARITSEGKRNADCDGKSGLTQDDATRILKLIAKLVTQDQMGKVI